jgi:hypothetical protein
LTFRRPIAAAALAALLAACGEDAPQEGEVSGEVLEGTISDEMIELEQVRTRAPLADPTAAAIWYAINKKLLFFCFHKDVKFI